VSVLFATLIAFACGEALYS